MSTSDTSEAISEPDVVYQAERDAIRLRRQRCWESTRNDSENKWKPQKPVDEDDYVGLALSGGGIRAASLGLGVLQKFCETGLINSVDYLSTVSGGGYIGSHFSSAIVSKKVPPERAFDDEPPEPVVGEPPKPAPGLSDGVKKLIYGGKYLIRPWELANKYLIGLVLTNLVILSGIIATAALVALAWRSLDTVFMRDVLELFDLNSDTFAAFLPFYVLAFCWFVAWMLSYFRHQAEAPGRWAQRWLYFAAAALLIGIVMLLVNGKETKIGFISAFFDSKKLESTGTISKWLLGFLATALLPFLRPKKLIQMGLAPRSLLDRVLFRVATCALLIGVPLAFVGVFALRNISQTASEPHDNLRPGDIRNWPAFASIVSGRLLPLTEAESQELGAIENRGNDQRLTPTEAKRAIDLRLRQLMVQKQELTNGQQELDKHNSRLLRLFFVAAWPLPYENPLRNVWQAQRKLESEAVAVCNLVNEYVLPSRALPVALANDVPLATIADRDDLLARGLLPPMLPTINAYANWMSSLIDGVRLQLLSVQPSQLDSSVVQAVKDDKKSLADSSDLKERMADATLSYRTFWDAADARNFNQVLLRTLHPECFFNAGAAYRWIVTYGDQSLRAEAFGWAALVFLLALSVDMNRTSLQRFYRNRLKRAYLVPPSLARDDVTLSDLNTTEYGGPYHLINTTLELTRPQFLDEVDEECSKSYIDRRDRQIFLFSQAYCGATATGWIPTKKYEGYLTENVSLGDAMAISGAASDAMLANSLPVALLITALNLALGQWMPNPKKGRPWSTARAGVLIRDWFRTPEDADYCFVCDGGFTDNLGVLSLLKRRCKVVIVLDSGCDPKREFSDLGVLIRTARVQEGVRIVEPDNHTKTLDTAALDEDKKGNCRQHFLIGHILYPKRGEPQTLDKKNPGWFIYLKPSFHGDEGSDLLKYRRQFPDFPNDTTADQFYVAARFESYRQLGVHLATALGDELLQDPGFSLFDRIEAMCKRLAAHVPLRSLPESANSTATSAIATVHELDRIATALEDSGPPPPPPPPPAEPEIIVHGQSPEMAAVASQLDRLAESAAAPATNGNGSAAAKPAKKNGNKGKKRKPPFTSKMRRKKGR